MRSSLPLFAAVLSLASSVLSAADTTPPKPPAVASADEIGKIEGIELTRPGGGFLGIKTEGVVLKVTFYDEKKKPVAADAVRIAARWQDNKPRRTVLLPATPETLVSPSVISRPFNYIIYLVLIGPDDKDIETHSLRLNDT